MSSVKPLMKTKEFADLCHTTKETILHYDRINLLKPVYTSNNGYRFYSPTQYFDYLRISSLKTLDVPLSKIHELESANLSEYLAELENLEKGIKEKIKELELSLRCIKNEIDYARVNTNMPLGEPFLTELEEYHFIVQEADFFSSYPIESKMMYDFSSQSNYVCGEYLFYTFDYKEFFETGIKKCKVGLQVTESVQGYETLTTKKGTYVMFNGVELWNSFDDAPQKMIDFMVENGLRAASDVYFVISKTHTSSESRKEELSSIYFMVEKI